MSDAGTKLWKFWKSINVKQAVLLAYHHQSNGQIKACIKFIKQTFKICANCGGDTNMALLQICTTPLGQGLLSLATLMFNQQVCSIMPVLNQKSIGKDYDDKYDSR